MKLGESIAECSPFDLHLAIIGLENQFVVFLRVAVLRRFLLYTQSMEKCWLRPKITSLLGTLDVSAWTFKGGFCAYVIISKSHVLV